MTCSVTGYMFSRDGKHTKCSKCGHCMECDHHKQTEMRHAHYQDYQSVNARLMPTTYHGVVCEVALCYCVKPDPFKKIVRK